MTINQKLLERLDRKKNPEKYLFEVEEYVDPRTDATVDELIKYFHIMEKDDPYSYVKNYIYTQEACGCMGSQDGAPLCSCIMRNELVKKKTEVLIKLG